MIPSSTLLDVSDFFVPHRILTSPVSIHAPTWGATYANANNASSNSFQSTLPHGERQAVWSIAATTTRFNPRSHTGSDAVSGVTIGRVLVVSIHAPTWGTTLAKQRLNTPKIVSIHAPTRGATALTYRGSKGFRSFNPRSHMGSDRVGIPNLAFQGCFNPRSYMGSDPPVHLGRTRCLVSTHAPTRGATKHVHAALQVVIVSTHAPTRGATTHTILLACARLVSTHAPAWGATGGS